MNKLLRFVAAVGLLLSSAAVPGQAQPAQTLPPKASYDITMPQDVDRLIAENYAHRKPPMNTEVIADSWKAILADIQDPAPLPDVVDHSQPPVKIIYDTDLGTDIDDAMALTFALTRPEIEVQAIVTARGEVQQRAAIVSRLLKVLGKTEVPFAPGSPELFGGGTLPRDKPVDQFPFAGSPENRPEPATQDAQQLLVDVINAHPQEVWLVVVGPMTNAALLIRDHPEVAAKLKGIAVMGGEPARLASETNIGNDPAAAAYCFQSGLVRFVATDDLCKRVIYPKADIDRLRQTDTPAAQALVELIGLWRKSQWIKPGPLCPDSYPLVWLIAPELLPTKMQGLTVEGAIVKPSDDAPRCAVTVDVKAVPLHRLVIDTLAGE